MIAELVTWRCKPGTMPKVEERMQAALPERARLSKPAAFWRSEVGMLHCLIQLWTYENLAERERIVAAAAKGGWPPEANEFVVEENSLILNPAPFNPPLGEQALGAIYEIRTYRFIPGCIAGEIERWTPMIAGRARLSPFVGAWYSEIGPLNTWISIWAYADAVERQRVRAEAVKQGLWPPKSPPGSLLTQESMLAVPLPFSPLR